MTERTILVLDRTEDLADQVRRVVADGDLRAEVEACTRVGSAAHIAEHEGPFSLVIAGPSLATHAGLKRLAGLRREMPGAAFIITFEQRPDASLREIVQVGAIDLLTTPIDDVTLTGAIRRALAIADAATIVLPEPTQAGRRARVFTICSATGGCGKTFLATNLAMFLAENSDARVALVDFDLQFGEITTALRLQPPYTIVDAVQRDDADDEDAADLSEHIDDYLVRYRDSFWTLAAPREPSQADEVSATDATAVLEAMRGHFDYIIVDTPTALAETVLAAFDLSEHLFVVATLDLPSVRNMSVFLQTLQRLKIDPERISLVLNKVERDIGIDPAQIEKHFPQGFIATLPYAREVSRSINVGTPVIGYAPGSPVSVRISDAMAAFLPEQDRERYHEARAAEPSAHGGVLSRLLRRRSAPVGGPR